ncbi:hypothetical protein Shyd_76400 [Streptomyces hydrogenans]|uniref:Uncharacterized protein n=1 Tax=Streptomyces hydrogenans TaxID=1873719 RepID=A0ABQ3PMN5_9ACTN|nr:hypothetical protein GCM10018784_14260 [Streptomyces hydrogenans]GHI26269.1 hypothetical protein Shyd_76400 [Streptomyces hydrogenans]
MRVVPETGPAERVDEGGAGFAHPVVPGHLDAGRRRQVDAGLGALGFEALGWGWTAPFEMRTPSPPGRVGKDLFVPRWPLWSRALEAGRTDARIVVTSE